MLSLEDILNPIIKIIDDLWNKNYLLYLLAGLIVILILYVVYSVFKFIIGIVF